MNERFVSKLDIAFIESEGTTLPNPSWEQVEDALSGFETNKVGRVTISNPEEVISMVIHGQTGVYHIGICEKEVNFHYFWNGLPNTGDTVDIAWNIFDAHQVCSDYTTMIKIVKFFYETGKMFDDVQWESEQL
jgi:hypothetical protein